MIGEGVLFSKTKRTLYLSLCLLFLSAILAGAASIPFVFESQTLWYKFGADKTLLRSGQIIGLLAALLLCVQVLLATRIAFLDRILGLDKVFRLHRVNSIFILLLALVHAALILIPEGISNLPIGRKYWPEMLGAILLLLLVSLVFSALLRQLLKLPYHYWHLIHRPIGMTVFFLLGIHILFVSDTFEKTLPRLALLLIMGTVLAFVIFNKMRILFQNKNQWQVTEIEPLNHTITRISVSPPENFHFSYAPGQFAFLTLNSKALSRERHPFTIVSSPTRKENLQFMIKSSGDWTKKVGSLQKGDQVSIEGPYGLFSYTTTAAHDTIVMIAGGIGITPMLSMLYHMADSDKYRNVTLIWSNKTRDDMVYDMELQELRKKRINLDIHLVFTSKTEKGGGRLNRETLGKLITTKKASIYLCGPLPMMENIRHLLVQLEYKKSQIYWEKFSL